MILYKLKKGDYINYLNIKELNIKDKKMQNKILNLINEYKVTLYKKNRILSKLTQINNKLHQNIIIADEIIEKQQDIF